VFKEIGNDKMKNEEERDMKLGEKDEKAKN